MEKQQLTTGQKILRELIRPFKRIYARRMSRAYDLSLPKGTEKRRLFDSIAEMPLVIVRSSHPFHHRYVEYFSARKEEIAVLTEKLIAGMDELSCDVVRRVISPYRFIAENNASVFLEDKDSCVVFPLSLMLTEREKEANLLEATFKNNELSYPFANICEHFGDIYKLYTKRALESVKCSYNSIYNLRSFPFDSLLARLEGRDVIDGGGYIGDTALAFTEFSPRCVHAFEPGVQTCKKMDSFFQKSGRQKMLKVVPKAIAGHSGHISFFETGSIGDSTLPEGRCESNKIEVPCVTLDDYCEMEKLDVGLIKLNIEGAEYDAIQGAIKTIQKNRPILAINLYHTPKDFFEIKPFLESLDLKYRFFVRQMTYQNCLDHTAYALCAFPE
jgi:FkbM family methyltransferase